MLKCIEKFNGYEKKKKIMIITAIVLIVAALCVGLYFSIDAIIKAVKIKDKERIFYADLKDTEIFANELDDALPQTVAHDIMLKHFTENTSGKTPKLLFIGYDGCTANVIPEYYAKEGSAIAKVASTGALYYTYAGGVKAGDQATSTAPGWSSIFTGKWATETGVKGNGDTLSESTKSIIYELAQKEKHTSFSVSWDSHFKVTYKKEIASAVIENLPAGYYLSETDDIGTVQNVLDSIKKGDDAIFCTLEATDHQGHETGFDTKGDAYRTAVATSEFNANLMLDAMRTRETYEQEDWLVIITTDHGGCAMGHGGKSVMERTTWLAVSKAI